MTEVVTWQAGGFRYTLPLPAGAEVKAEQGEPAGQPEAGKAAESPPAPAAAEADASPIRPEPEGTDQGVMIALMLPGKVAAQVAVPGGISPDQLHCTIGYPGKAPELDTTRERLVTAVTEAVQGWPPIEGTINGAGRFGGNDPDHDAVFSFLDAPLLPDFRQVVAAAMETAGCPVHADHGFVPHVSLGYVSEGTEGVPVPVLDKIPVVFAAVTVMWAQLRTDIPLTGPEETQPADQEHSGPAGDQPADGADSKPGEPAAA